MMPVIKSNPCAPVMYLDYSAPGGLTYLHVVDSKTYVTIS